MRHVHDRRGLRPQVALTRRSSGPGYARCLRGTGQRSTRPARLTERLQLSGNPVGQRSAVKAALRLSTGVAVGASRSGTPAVPDGLGTTLGPGRPDAPRREGRGTSRTPDRPTGSNTRNGREQRARAAVRVCRRPRDHAAVRASPVTRRYAQPSSADGSLSARRLASTDRPISARKASGSVSSSGPRTLARSLTASHQSRSSLEAAIWANT